MPKTLERVAQLLTLDTTLLRRPRTQTHQHTHTCYKRSGTKCRFRVPFMPSNETRIVVPFPPAPKGDDAESEWERQRVKALKKKYDEMHESLESGDFEDLASFLRAFGLHSEKEFMDVLRGGLWRPCVHHRRTPAEKFVNAFNAWIGRVLDSNMDMQIILDHYACAFYVVDYVNKSDRGMSNLKRILAEILKTNPNDDIEADMSHKSREVVYVPTCCPEERVRVRKTRAELEALPPGSTDVWKANFVQKYEARLPTLSDVCLADFASKYQPAKGDCRYVLRVRPAVILYRGYNPGNDVESYMRENVLLYVPF
ncbi:hypothetical protein HPB51_017438 [Rhipicephalus microplus]|uniref:Uncharacterized protein n=1 Tax=Rhipicephalus microplus TaxID=6941 RepID=A0A9J6E2F2_RHIMP|nr:hypothetical protein HPB51_017438 [Rhipicephalus microplus]